MPSNIEGKLYLGDILLSGKTTQALGIYALSESFTVNFDSIIHDQYNNISDFNSVVALGASYNQLYVYNSGIS